MRRAIGSVQGGQLSVLLGPGPPIILIKGEHVPRMTGAKFIVQRMQAYGVTHAFYISLIVIKVLVEREKVGICRIMTHGEKAAAYMAGSPVIAIIGRATSMQRYRHHRLPDGRHRATDQGPQRRRRRGSHRRGGLCRELHGQS